MNIVKIANKVALIAVVILMYWVFIFVCLNIFDFKIFIQDFSDVFLLGLVGIFSILLAAMILNIMLNLTAIAQGRVAKHSQVQSKSLSSLMFIASLMAVFLLLYLGDVATTKKTESYLVSSASALVEQHEEAISRFANYEFSRTYIEKTRRNILLMGKVDRNFPSIAVVVRGDIENKTYLMTFNSHQQLEVTNEPKKEDYILSVSNQDRKYLNAVFDGESKQHRFSSGTSGSELFFPVETRYGMVVLHLSQLSY